MTKFIEDFNDFIKDTNDITPDEENYDEILEKHW